MKKIAAIFLTLVFIFGLVGCSNSNGTNTNVESSREYSEEYANIPLKKFIPSAEEFETIYNNSGMPTIGEGKEFVQWDSSQYLIYRSENVNSQNYEVCWLNLKEYSITHSHKRGRLQNIDYMLKPVLLYIRDVPDALLDWQKIVEEWEKVEGVKNNSTGSTDYSFTKNGITYTKTVYTGKFYNGAGKLVTKEDMRVTVAYDPEFSFDLNQYPLEYIDKIRN